MNNLPPFYVGQEVVCINDSSPLILPVKKNEIYTVLGVRFGCCSWEVYLGHQSAAKSCSCGKCTRINPRKELDWYLLASRFAPKDQFKAITFTKVLETELVSEN